MMTILPGNGLLGVCWGYERPAFRRYRENGPTFSEARFVTESDAKEWAEFKNKTGKIMERW